MGTECKSTVGVQDGVAGEGTKSRKPYVSPTVENLGDLRAITLGASAGVGESGGRKTKTGRG